MLGIGGAIACWSVHLPRSDFMNRTSSVPAPVQLPEKSQQAAVHDRAARILARSFYRELRHAEYRPGDVLTIVTVMLDLLTKEMRAAGAASSNGASIEPSRGVVLALGGGGARAMAHVGVLRVLRRALIPILGVTGTSAGALVAALV